MEGSAAAWSGSSSSDISTLLVNLRRGFVCCRLAYPLPSLVDLSRGELKPARYLFQGAASPGLTLLVQDRISNVDVRQKSPSLLTGSAQGRVAVLASLRRLALSPAALC